MLPINEPRLGGLLGRECDIVSHESFSEWLARRNTAKPFLRWAGGKTAFLHRYGSLIPRFHGRYVEPFLGSGSVFFYVQRTHSRPTPALLGDANLQLVLTFHAVRDEPMKVFERLEIHRIKYQATRDNRTYYDEVRESYNALLPDVDAADFIFLNRTCWNGLYRLNRAGQFNVPHGKGPAIFPTLDDLLNAAAALRQSQLRAASWENVVASCESEDFVFFDPPYFSDLATAPKYGETHFDLSQHKKLSKALHALQRRGIDFILTNSGEPEIIAIYRDAGLFIEPTSVPRSINSDAANRVAADEIIVTPRPLLKLI